MNEQWTAGKSKTTEMSPQPKHLCLEESRQSSAWKEQMGKIGGAAWPKAVHRFFGLTEDAGMKCFLFQGLWHGGMFISGPPETAWKAGNVSAFQGYTAYSIDNGKQPAREWALVRKRLCSYCCPGQRQRRDKRDRHLPQRPRKNLIHVVSFLHSYHRTLPWFLVIYSSGQNCTVFQRASFIPTPQNIITVVVTGFLLPKMTITGMGAISREREMLWSHPQEEGMRATVIWGCCHIRGAPFSKLPLKKNFIYQDGKANTKGAGN